MCKKKVSLKQALRSVVSLIFQWRETMSVSDSHDDGGETAGMGFNRKSVNSFRQVDSADHEDISAADGARTRDMLWND